MTAEAGRLDTAAQEAAEWAEMLVREAIGYGSAALDEAAAKTVLAAYGIPVPAGILVGDEKEAAAAAERLGGKLAVKAVGENILHKTEKGLVLLDVEGGEAAAEAFRILRKRAGDDLAGALVERMVGGRREFMAGMKRDPVFGPVIAFGLGGVLTEVLADVAFAVAPLSERDALGLPAGIRSSRLLEAFRGEPAVDRRALAQVLRALARIALDFPEIAEIDINPLKIDGDRPVAADALVILRAQAGEEHKPGEAPAIATADRRAIRVGGRQARPDLSAVLAPRSVAIIGASDDVTKWGGSALRNLLDGGFSGAVYPVNPRGGVYFGVPAYTSLAEVPEAPDLALLAVGAAQVEGVLEDCGRRGIKAAVVFTAGYSETGTEGAEREQRLVEIAAAYGVTLIGPNCMGVLANESRLHGTGFVALHPPQGRLSFVSQSGSMGPTVVNLCERRGIGVEKFVSVGNEAQVSAFDVLDYLAEDPATGCVMMYLEGIEDGRHFLDAAQRTTASKPVVVLRGGLTEAGSKAAASHTGALAGSAAVFQAAARQCGVVMSKTAQDLVDLGACLAYLPLPRGRRVAVVTNGGGPGVLAADAVVLNGLTLARLPDSVIAALDSLLPPFWSKRNPLDLVAAGFGEVGFRALEVLAGCEEVDAILALNFLGVPSTGGKTRPRLANGEYDGFTDWETEFLRLVATLMTETGKPIINVPDHPVYGTTQDLGDHWAPVILASPWAAAQALDRMAWYAEYRQELTRGIVG